MRRHPNDDTVRAAFDRFHRSTDPKPVADVQLRNELRRAGVKPEFEGENR